MHHLVLIASPSVTEPVLASHPMLRASGRSVAPVRGNGLRAFSRGCNEIHIGCSDSERAHARSRRRRRPLRNVGVGSQRLRRACAAFDRCNSSGLAPVAQTVDTRLWDNVGVGSQTLRRARAAFDRCNSSGLTPVARCSSAHPARRGGNNPRLGQ
jgi:hypothetical protein